MITASEKVKSDPGVVDVFKELPIYNKHIKKLKIKRFENIDLLSELFYQEPNVIKKIIRLEDMQ